MRICELKDCENKYFSKGYCRFHYQRKRRGVPLDAAKYRQEPEPEQKKTINMCKEEGCYRPKRAQGYCVKHYVYQKYHGNLIIAKFRTACEVKDCKKKHFGLGYCKFHYTRHRTGVPLTVPKHYKGNSGCRVKNCHSKHYANSLCSLHWNRTVREVDLHTKKNYRDKKYNTLIEKECETCGVKYKVFRCKKHRSKYCSNNCKHEGLRIKY